MYTKPKNQKPPSVSKKSKNYSIKFNIGVIAKKMVLSYHPYPTSRSSSASILQAPLPTPGKALNQAQNGLGKEDWSQSGSTLCSSGLKGDGPNPTNTRFLKT